MPQLTTEKRKARVDENEASLTSIVNYQRLYASAVSGFFCVLFIAIGASFDIFGTQNNDISWKSMLFGLFLIFAIVGSVEFTASAFTKRRVRKHQYRYEHLHLLDSPVLKVFPSASKKLKTKSHKPD
jgi:hypothetical protein